MTLIEFTAAMEKKLIQNHFKGYWNGCSKAYLIKRLRQELKELVDALESGSRTEAVTKEAADVANFAYMIADNFGVCGHLTTVEEKP